MWSMGLETDMFSLAMGPCEAAVPHTFHEEAYNKNIMPIESLLSYAPGPHLPSLSRLHRQHPELSGTAHHGKALE